MGTMDRREFLAAAETLVGLAVCSRSSGIAIIDFHDQQTNYPRTPVTRGGISDRLLSDYPNIYGDLSANSGLNSLLRDKDHARGFLDRHQDRLLWASDCPDTLGEGNGCNGFKGLAAVRRLAPNPGVIHKILHGNAAKLLKLV